MSFNFVGSPTGSGSPFGTTTTTTTSFGFGTNTAPKTTSAFSFGSDAPKTGGIFGSPSNVTTTASSIFGASPPPNFSFGSTMPTQTPLFGAQPQSTLSTTTAQSTTGFNFGQASQNKALFAFNSPNVQNNTGTQNKGLFGFGSPSTQASSTSVQPNIPQTSTVSFGAKTTTVAWPSFGTPASTAAFTTFTPPVTITTAASFGNNFGFGGGSTTVQPTTSAPVVNFGFAQNSPNLGSSVPTNTTSVISPTFSGFSFGQSQTPSTVNNNIVTSKPTVSFDTTISSVMINPAIQVTTSSFAFGGGNVIQSTSSPMFNFGKTTASVASNVLSPTSVNFTTTPSALPFTKPTTTVSSTGFNVANLQPTTTSTLQPAVTSQFSFGNAPSGNVNFGVSSASGISPLTTTTSVVITKPSVIAFGNTPQPSSSGFTFGGSVSTLGSTSTSSTVVTTFSGFQIPSQPTAQIISPITTTATIEKAKLSTSGITTSLPPVSLPTITSTPAPLTTTSTTSTTGFQLPAITSVGAVTTVGAIVSTASSITTQPTSASSMNFSQLEDAINKWSLELEEQEKVFINQATQVNAWDKLLIANGEKIVALNEALQFVRTEQQGLDHELDFIVGQQRELEELLTPLEKELGNVVICDSEREHTYRLGDSIDTQLKQMSEDLKEIIEHLNESNRREDNNDPIVQIGRILNAHMSSIQWIDSSTAQISHKLDQLSAMHSMLKRQNQRSFKRTYN